MNIPLKWLREYVDITLPVEQLAERLTLAGIEVANIRRIGGNWDPQKLFVGQVVEITRHPNADRLLLVTVEYGAEGATGEQSRRITVVTGATNMRVGDKVPLALAGARLIDPHSEEPKEMVLKPTTLRGVRSEGMVCSPKELGLSEDHEGILILHPEARVGAPLSEELGDIILELEVTPNRPDCLSVIGVAREVAALTGQTLRLPSVEAPEEGPPAGELASVEIENPELCARYIAMVVQGVTVKPSPKWMQERLERAGMRPINNVVDVTNYVMLEWGQPLHAFDYDTLRGHRIIVRTARPGEAIVTLDGQMRTLTPEMLVIADAERPVAIAGVMGGLETEVGDRTTTVLLESANFNPVSIRRTARALNIPSEAQRRFEKGLPPELTVPAIRRAAQLIRELAGTAERRPVIAKGMVDAYPRPAEPRRIRLAASEVRRVLGMDIPPDRQERILTSLGFSIQREDQALLVTVPYWRRDVTLPADLVEELARISGYDELPATLPEGRLPPPRIDRRLYWEEIARDVLVGCGLSECITYALTSRERLRRLLPADPEALALSRSEDGAAGALVAEVEARLLPLGIQPLKLWNPMTSDADVLRTSAMPHLLETLWSNLRYQDSGVALFEIGRIYLPHPSGRELPQERKTITVVLGQYKTSPRRPSPVEYDYYDLKGIAETLLERLGIRSFAFRPVVHPTFHPGRAAVITLPAQPPTAGVPGSGSEPVRRGHAEEQVVGILGEVSPEVRRNFDIDERAYLMGLDFDLLLQYATTERQYQPLPKYPPVVQDIALIVDEAVPAAEVEQAIRAAGGELVADVRLFDVYRGDPIPPGKKSLAYTITYQAPNRTLTDEEVNQHQARIVQRLEQELGATLRG
jgi:phenylalanyl-tRNA synthetase beta chain